MPATAQTQVADPVVEELEAQGYLVTEIERTWLGRILITARNDTYLREVVLNRVTGDVLSDRAFLQGDKSQPDVSVNQGLDETGDAISDAIGEGTDAVGDTLGGSSGAASGGLGGIGSDGGGGVGGGIGGIGDGN